MPGGAPGELGEPGGVGDGGGGGGGGAFLAMGRGGPTTPRGRIDFGGGPLLGISCFNLSSSGATGGGEAEGGSGEEGVGTCEGGGEEIVDEVAKGEGNAGVDEEEGEEWEACNFC
jgi:hypothetical protein